MMKAASFILTVLAIILFPCFIFSQSPLIGVIDFYGLQQIPEKKIREAIAVKEGDSTHLFNPGVLVPKLKTIPGVKNGSIVLVCCDEKTGQQIAYIGIEEKEMPAFSYHPSPSSNIKLPEEITAAYQEFFTYLVEGIQKGESSEDRSQGHSLLFYPPARKVQDKFIMYASTKFRLLKEVLRNSSDAEHRSIAAHVIAYVKDKARVIDDLLYAAHDSEDDVRNNATRALALIAGFATDHPELKLPKIPADPFIQMISSITWTDRNKGVAVLLALTEKRDSLVLTQLKDQALLPIADMAKWKSEGHAMMGFMLLGRMAGHPDQKILADFGGERKKHIEEYIKSIAATKKNK